MPLELRCEDCPRVLREDERDDEEVIVRLPVIDKGSEGGLTHQEDEDGNPRYLYVTVGVEDEELDEMVPERRFYCPKCLLEKLDNYWEYRKKLPFRDKEKVKPRTPPGSPVEGGEDGTDEDGKADKQEGGK